MDQQEKELLAKTYALARENNEMLHLMRRSIRLGQMMRLLYWVLIIAGTIGTFVYVQPFVTQLLGTYEQATKQLGEIRNAGEQSQNIIQQFQELLR